MRQHAAMRRPRPSRVEAIRDENDETQGAPLSMDALLTPPPPQSTVAVQIVRQLRASSSFVWGFIAGAAVVSALVALAALLILVSLGR